jgi:hypothetical protein
MNTPGQVKEPGLEFVEWAIKNVLLKSVYDQFDFKNDATNFNTMRPFIVNKINKMFAERTESFNPKTGICKWVNPKDRLPEKGGWYVVKFYSGDYDERRWMDEKDWWLKHIEKWLDDPHDVQPPSSAIPQREEREGEEFGINLAWTIIGGYIGKIDLNHWTIEQVRESLSQDWEYLQSHYPSPLIPQSENDGSEAYEKWLDKPGYQNPEHEMIQAIRRTTDSLISKGPEAGEKFLRDAGILEPEAGENQEMPEEIRVRIIEAADKWARDHDSEDHWKSAAMAYRFGCMDMFEGIKKGMYDKWLPQISSLKEEVSNQKGQWFQASLRVTELLAEIELLRKAGESLLTPHQLEDRLKAHAIAFWDWCGKRGRKFNTPVGEQYDQFAFDQVNKNLNHKAE